MPDFRIVVGMLGRLRDAHTVRRRQQRVKAEECELYNIMAYTVMAYIVMVKADECELENSTPQLSNTHPSAPKNSISVSHALCHGRAVESSIVHDMLVVDLLDRAKLRAVRRCDDVWHRLGHRVLGTMLDEAVL